MDAGAANYYSFIIKTDYATSDCCAAKLTAWTEQYRRYLPWRLQWPLQKKKRKLVNLRPLLTQLDRLVRLVSLQPILTLQRQDRLRHLLHYYYSLLLQKAAADALTTFRLAGTTWTAPRASTGATNADCKLASAGSYCHHFCYLLRALLAQN